MVALVGLADGLAMLFPGPSSGVTGLFLTGASLGWLLLALPWLCRPAYRPYYGVVVSAFGVLVLPVLFFPVAITWFVTSPSALSAWFVCAWVVVWSACFAILAFVKCPSCQQSPIANPNQYNWVRPLRRLSRASGRLTKACSRTGYYLGVATFGSMQVFRASQPRRQCAVGR